MFVAPGARAALRERRKLAFEDQFIAPLLREAAALGISPAELANMITKEVAR